MCKGEKKALNAFHLKQAKSLISSRFASNMTTAFVILVSI